MKTYILPGHVNPRTGLTEGAVRSQAATNRLARLHDTIPGLRPFTVLRRTVTSTPREESRGGERTFVLVPFSVVALNGADAGRLADASKYAREQALGHHSGQRA